MCVCMGTLETIAIVGAVATPVAAAIADRFRARGRKVARRTVAERRTETSGAPESTGERRDLQAGDRRATDELRAECRDSIDAYESARERLAAALERAAAKRRPLTIAERLFGRRAA